MSDLREQIADLEVELEQLSDAVERCRKLMIAAKVGCIGGAVLLLLTLCGLLGAVALIFAIAAGLGGAAMFGSNKSTRDQIRATVITREAQRAEMINALELRILD